MRAVAVAMLVALGLAACAGAPKKPISPATTRIEPRSPPRTLVRGPRRSPYAPAQEDLSKRGNYTRGGLYAPEIQDSAPGGLPDVDLIPEPEVRAEPRSRYGNRSPYAVLGKTYSVVDDPAAYDEVGLASFYGNKFHGRRTSNLEVYDMYAFSAAHKTLPLPSYARVTNLSNGRSVVVRVNDRGPFHDGRIIDLSYAAAVKLGVDRAGTARVQVRGLRAGEDAIQPEVVAAPLLQALPPGVHVATGKPTPTVEAGPRSTILIDHLVGALPIASAGATEAPPSATQSKAADPAAQRFDMRQDGRTMTADEFDAWMRGRRMRVATGRPGTPDRIGAAAIAPSLPKVAAPASLAPLPSATPRPASPAAGGDRAVTLQVASFAARANAEHAMAMLAGAGIGGARLLDADANGRKVWRLRVGPVNAATASELGARIQGLGFGQPQPVRE